MYYLGMKGTANNDAGGRGDWQGMNWIRQEKRLAIYLRDGLACVWCGIAVEDGYGLTLDHLTPHSRGGSNQATNLVTSCHRCNSSRGSRSINKFAVAVAEYLDHDADPAKIAAHVRRTARLMIDVPAAKIIIDRRK